MTTSRSHALAACKHPPDLAEQHGRPNPPTVAVSLQNSQHTAITSVLFVSMNDKGFLLNLALASASQNATSATTTSNHSWSSAIAFPTLLSSPSAIGLLHSTSPNATRAALRHMDQAMKNAPRYPDTSSASLVSFFTFDGHVLAHVDSQQATHTVMLRDLAYKHGQLRVLPFNEHAVLRECSCDCKAFSFGAEPFCKHIAITVLACAPAQSTVTPVSEQDFHKMLISNEC